MSAPAARARPAAGFCYRPRAIPARVPVVQAPGTSAAAVLASRGGDCHGLAGAGRILGGAVSWQARVAEKRPPVTFAGACPPCAPARTAGSPPNGGFARVAKPVTGADADADRTLSARGRLSLHDCFPDRISGDRQSL